MGIGPVFSDVSEFGKSLTWYTSRKLSYFGAHFEGAKGVVIDILKARRGTYQKPFLHVGMVFLMITAVLAAPIIANEYPTSAASSSVANSASPSSVLNNQADIMNTDTVTVESQKLRRDVEDYTVQTGDTLSSIGKKYDVDAASIGYLNNFDTENKVLKPGETIKIPPVTGLIVTVRSGETIYTVAKKYGLLSPQPIVDWPYNSFANDETFALAAGQELVVPGGKPPEEVLQAPAPIIHTPSAGPFAGGNGQFLWPVAGIITQYFSGYHPALDIAGSQGDNVLAADAGRIVTEAWMPGGYGNYIIIDHGNGYKTLYGHLVRFVAGEGENVARGQIIGLRGTTGRSTGPHLHFEIIQNGVRVNPLGLLR